MQSSCKATELDAVPGERVAARVYKGARREGAYLFVPARDSLARVPPARLEAMGRLELVVEVELHRDRRLAREDVRVVMRNLEDQGYHLQMPPADARHGRSPRQAKTGPVPPPRVRRGRGGE